MIFVTEAQIRNREISALGTFGNVAPQYFETGLVTTALLLQGGLNFKIYHKHKKWNLYVTTALLLQGGLNSVLPDLGEVPVEVTTALLLQGGLNFGRLDNLPGGTETDT